MSNRPTHSYMLQKIVRLENQIRRVKKLSSVLKTKDQQAQIISQLIDSCLDTEIIIEDE